MEKKNTNEISRRKFIGNVATAAAGLTILPSFTSFGGLGRFAPSDKLNIAGVGIGGMGGTNINNLDSQNIIALCDVDWDYSAGTFEEYPNAKKFKDYRKKSLQLC